MFKNKYFQIFFDPNEPNGNPNPAEPKEPAPAEPKSDLENLDVKELVSMIKDLRSEAKNHRLAKNDLQSKLEVIEAKEKKAKEDEEKKKGNYEQLLKDKESEIETLKSKATAYDEYYNSQVNSVKEKLGEDWMDEYSKLSLNALQKLGDKFGKSITTKIDVDNPNKQPKKTTLVELNDEDKKEALFMFPNLTENEAYDFYKDIKLKKLELKKKKET